MRVYKCKACGAPIVWIKTLNGKSMPCDAVQIPYTEKRGGSLKIVTDDGRVISAKTPHWVSEADGVGRTPHWATCPQAGSFRKGGAK